MENNDLEKELKDFISEQKLILSRIRRNYEIDLEELNTTIIERNKYNL